jgi:hypothetical protein
LVSYTATTWARSRSHCTSNRSSPCYSLCTHPAPSSADFSLRSPTCLTGIYLFRCMYMYIHTQPSSHGLPYLTNPMYNLYIYRMVSLARTGWLAAALVPMPMAFFLMWKQQDVGALVAGTAMVGLSSGFIFAAAVSVTSELFGPNSIGVNHNILITNIPLGSLLYGQIAAMVYDANGQRMTLMDNRTGIIDTMIVCMGVKCYSTTFLVWGCITLLGLVSSVVLFIRTKPAYAAAGRSSCKHLHQVSS